MSYKLPLITLCCLSISACGGGSGETPVPDNEGYVGEYVYDIPQYQDALDSADLQYLDLSTSPATTTVVSAGNYNTFSDARFYLDSDSTWLTMQASGENTGTELRFNNNFLSEASDHYRLSATLLPISPNQSVANSSNGQQMTLLQVANEAQFAPLLRIIWDGATRNQHSNSYWALINSENCTLSEASEESNACFSYYHLADYDSATASKFEILVSNNQLSVNVDQQQQVTLDITNWSGIEQHFRAGVSNQYTGGNSEVQFKTLAYNSNLAMATLSNTLPPSENFDLLDWYLSIPTDTDNSNSADSIKENTLNAGYENSQYFYTGADGGMVFKTPVSGFKTSTNTKYVRTELREMLRRGDTSIATQGVNENNWVFSSAPDAAQSSAGGVDGILQATLAVNHVTSTGEAYQKGRVIIGQIHANDDEPIRLYYRLLPGHTKGSIYFAHEPTTGSEQWISMIGSKDDDAPEPSDGIALDEKFYYKIKVQGNLLSVTLKRDYKDDIIKTWNMSASGFDDEDQYMYFKAGVYNQNNSGNEDDYVQATFYYLDNQHTGYAPEQ